ncbi:hypothetical protein D172_018175 (plasmid) [Pseudoalteromonas sp. Bsw20308]|nr:hypothetical protein D172_018175 [Pseudoalteromonas sp. Bsw20308]
MNNMKFKTSSPEPLQSNQKLKARRTFIKLSLSLFTSTLIPSFYSKAISNLENSNSWSIGERVELCEGQTITCTSLFPKRIYCVLIYNMSKNDRNVFLDVNWSNQQAPKKMTIPGSENKQGDASLILVSGNDTSTISLSITSGNGGQIECFLLSTAIESPSPNLPIRHIVTGGKRYIVEKYQHYLGLINRGWYHLTLENKISQSVVLQIQHHQVIIYILNPTQTPLFNITSVGSITKNKDYLIQRADFEGQPQRIEVLIQGNEETIMWVGASSKQALNNTTLALQALSITRVLSREEPSTVKRKALQCYSDKNKVYSGPWVNQQ